MTLLGVGRIGFWQGGSLWLGRGLSATVLHAHHAIQLCFGLDGPVRLRSQRAQDWDEFPTVFIPSMVPHALDASGRLTAALFCEPQSKAGRGLMKRFGRARPVPLPDSPMLIERMARIGEEMEQGSDPETACLAMLVELAGIAPNDRPTDQRILRAVAFIADNLERPIRLSEAAAIAALSPGRFRHLFVAEIGVTFRSYVLWLRLQHALQTGLRGASWTEAAHEAGFADLAHLSRTFRRMLGISPTAIPRGNP